ncbi:Uncharacterized protein FWK35_00015969 [Aphis craccivora]|uniref:Uncharacterized protein n=1 Tax=Aphis craccivora TaxID=307492 RepID=A0A6G0XZH4_APHCR|nr:Uncharacterized protein FWK35_00015969 [Aphis craccivora]
MTPLSHKNTNKPISTPSLFSPKTYTMRAIYKPILINKCFHSERSEECIDFTMMCVFFLFFFIFVSVTTFWSMCPVSNRKVNVVGTLGGQNIRKNPKKVTEKCEFLPTQNQFSTQSIFLYGYKSKTNHCKNYKFSPKC